MLNIWPFNKGIRRAAALEAERRKQALRASASSQPRRGYAGDSDDDTIMSNPAMTYAAFNGFGVSAPPVSSPAPSCEPSRSYDSSPSYDSGSSYSSSSSDSSSSSSCGGGSD